MTSQINNWPEQFVHYRKVDQETLSDPVAPTGVHGGEEPPSVDEPLSVAADLDQADVDTEGTVPPVQSRSTHPSHRQGASVHELGHLRFGRPADTQARHESGTPRLVTSYLLIVTGTRNGELSTFSCYKKPRPGCPDWTSVASVYWKITCGPQIRGPEGGGFQDSKQRYAL